MTELVQIPVHHIRDNGSMADGGRKYTVYTPELLPEHIVALADAGRKAGWMVYKVNAELSVADIPKDDAPVEADMKTPSQRLRAVIWRIWEANGSKGDFEGYYRRSMEALIEKLKQRLEP